MSPPLHDPSSSDECACHHDRLSLLKITRDAAVSFMYIMHLIIAGSSHHGQGSIAVILLIYGFICSISLSTGNEKHRW